MRINKRKFSNIKRSKNIIKDHIFKELLIEWLEILQVLKFVLIKDEI